MLEFFLVVCLVITIFAQARELRMWRRLHGDAWKLAQEWQDMAFDMQDMAFDMFDKSVELQKEIKRRGER